LKIQTRLVGSRFSSIEDFAAATKRARQESLIYYKLLVADCSYAHGGAISNQQPAICNEDLKIYIASI
jgi:hypothetical protein